MQDIDACASVCAPSSGCYACPSGYLSASLHGPGCAPYITEPRLGRGFFPLIHPLRGSGLTAVLLSSVDHNFDTPPFFLPSYWTRSYTGGSGWVPEGAIGWYFAVSLFSRSFLPRPRWMEMVGAIAGPSTPSRFVSLARPSFPLAWAFRGWENEVVLGPRIRYVCPVNFLLAC